MDLIKNFSLLTGTDIMARAKNSNKSIAQQINDYYQSKLKEISNEKVLSQIKPIFIELLKESETYKSIVSGDGYLRGALGFPYGEEQEMIDSIIYHIADSVELKLNPSSVNGNFNFNIDLNVKISDSGVFNLPEAIIETEKGEQLEWLRWLLEEGTKPVISGHHVSFNLNYIQSGYSRSHLALMFKNGSFAIPAQFAGTEDDNWIKRALSNGSGGLNESINQKLLESLRIELDRVYNG